MNKIECYIVCDLLPLYIDNVCSKQTAKDVEAHLQTCKDCKKLYEEMSLDFSSDLHTPEFESNKIFRHVLKNIVGIIIALAAMISSFVINSSGAWAGHPAGIGNFTITLFYIIFWSMFTFTARYEPLITTSFVINLITFISAVVRLIAHAANRGGFITGLLALFSGVPFYGLTLVMEWSGLNAVAMILSLCWLIYTWRTKRKLKRSLPQES